MNKKREYVTCQLCHTVVQLTKRGHVPEHYTQSLFGWRWDARRCNGLQQGLHVAPAARIEPWRRVIIEARRTRYLRRHQAGKSTENDPKQRWRRRAPWRYRQ